MKKLMTVAAAALCAAVAFGADAVESDNIVGFIAPTVQPTGGNSLGVPFVNTTGEAIPLTAIIPMDGENAAGDFSFKLNYFDRAINGFRILYWWNELYDSEGNDIIGSGWGDIDQMEVPAVAGKTFAAGEGFILTPQVVLGTPKITVSGQVVSTDETEPVNETVLAGTGGTSCGNVLPVACNLTEVIPTDGDAAAGDFSFKLNYFDRAINGFRILYWWNELYDSEGNDVIGSGWGDIDQMEVPAVAGKQFAAGEGMIVTPQVVLGTPKITFPNTFFKGDR